MAINLAIKNEPTKFYFDDSDPKEGWLLMRAAPKSLFDDIEKQTVTERKKFKRGQYVIDRKVNTEKQNHLLWDYCIVDWGELNVDGTSLPCTTENKILLMNGSPQFLSFYAVCMEQLEDITPTEGTKRKNSEPQSSDPSTSSTAMSANLSERNSDKKRHA